MPQYSFKVEQQLEHYGICDASAAVPLDQDHFLVADDEDNILRIYRSYTSGDPVSMLDVNSYFVNNPKQREVDIEAATQIGEIIYWITSHGTNKQGKLRPERRQFFGNKILINNGSWSLKQVGSSYTQLLEDMLLDKSLEKYQFATAATIPPKEKGGLNIEGLAVTPQQELLIGFRNPFFEDKAIVLTLKNPKDLLKKDTRAIFGEAIELDLNGLGIRSIEYWESENCYLIAAGAYDSNHNFSLYQWSGIKTEKPELIEVTGLPSNFIPESVLFYPNRDGQLQLLSDDGSIERIQGTPCKSLAHDDPNKYFRTVWITRE